MKGELEELVEAVERGEGGEGSGAAAQSAWTKALDAMEDDDGPSCGAPRHLGEAAQRRPSPLFRPSRPLDAQPRRRVPRSASPGTERQALPTAWAPPTTWAPTKSREVARAGVGASRADVRALKALVNEQEMRLGGILRELREHGRKRNHWIWYVFPTDKEGFADPAGTRVTAATAPQLCAGEPTASLWRQVLELLCDMIERDGPHHVLHLIDHGRIFFFIRFWQSLEDAPPWMRAVCERLAQFRWSSF